MPVPEPDVNEVLVETRYLSNDSHMHGRVRDVKSYAEP